MDNQKNDYRVIISEVIKKQMIILGPEITLSRTRNVKGLKVDDSGEVLEISGPPQELIQELINQFVQLSGLIVQKTMEPILASYPQDGSSSAILSSIQAQIHPAGQSPPPDRVSGRRLGGATKSQDDKSKEKTK